ncbi:hypothetical protein EMIT0111MI5_270040 [Burkholderia sp. IT-111MI5]
MRGPLQRTLRQHPLPPRVLLLELPELLEPLDAGRRQAAGMLPPVPNIPAQVTRARLIRLVRVRAKPQRPGSQDIEEERRI